MFIFDGLVNGLLTAGSWSVMPYIIIGSLYGLTIGVIPGLSGHFAMAMLIPFIYGMEPASGIALILAGHAAVAQGGGVTAILFGVPGTGQNAATLLDGPALTEKGEAGRALGAGLTACFLGALFGALVLTFLIPVLRHVVLFFGPPEFFMLAVLALTFIAVLGGKGTMIKGFIAGALGLLFSFVGMDNVTGALRFTFGFLELWEGIGMVPLLLGVFAFAEMIHLWVRGGSLAAKTAKDLSSKAMQKQIFRGVLDTFTRWWQVIRCSAIGTTIGLIPGLGSTSAAFIAYAHAKQTSKNPEAFGKGSIEGVIASESANDAVEGGALASTVAFGIPGSSSMAILIGALIILGIQPGPRFMVEQIDLVFVMIWTVILGNLLGTVWGVFIANPLAKMTFLRSSILVPVLLTVIFTGAYTVHRSWFDIVIVILFGLLGYAMRVCDYSRAAFIIGFVLGIIVEKNLYLSLRLYGQMFFLQPVALALLIITVTVIAYNAWTILKSEKKRDMHAA